MKKFTLIVLFAFTILLAGCTYKERVCDISIQECKVIAVEQIVEGISDFESKLSLGLSKRANTIREIIIDCDGKRSRKHSDTYIVGDIYPIETEKNCTYIEKDLETNQIVD